MLTCCICGGSFEEDDNVLRLTVYRYVDEEQRPNFTLLRGRFDDGTPERYTHYSCPIIAGAPMSLIGATGEHIDE